MYTVMLETFATQIKKLNCEDDNETMTAETSTVKLLPERMCHRAM